MKTPSDLKTPSDFKTPTDVITPVKLTTIFEEEHEEKTTSAKLVR